MPVRRPVQWVGDPPTECELGSEPITTQFVDARTIHGGWAILCPACHIKYGERNTGVVGQFGEGLGQQYTKQDDGRWIKTAG